MAMIEYFISGLLYIFQNQMECHFFFFQERWGTSLSSFPIQTTHSLASKINGLGVSRGEKGRNKILPPFHVSLPAWPTSLPPSSPRTPTHCPLDHSSSRLGIAPFLTPVSKQGSNHKVT